MRFGRSHEADGFSLVELLVVITVLGILATIVTFAVRNLTDDGAQSVCDSDRQTLATAIELYLGERGLATIPGPDAAARMQTLIDAELLHSTATTYEIEPDGSLTGLGACA